LQSTAASERSSTRGNKQNKFMFLLLLSGSSQKKKRRITITSGYMEITYQVSKSQRRRKEKQHCEMLQTSIFF
jgi:hypothetical protein